LDRRQCLRCLSGPRWRFRSGRRTGKGSGRFGVLSRTSCPRFRSRRRCSRPFWAEVPGVLAYWWRWASLGCVGRRRFGSERILIWLPPSSNLAPFLAFSRLTKQPPKNRQTPTILRLQHINFIPSSKLSFTHILGSSSRIQLVPDATSTLHCRQVLSDTKQTQQTFLDREMAYALSCMLTKVGLSPGPISKHSSLFGPAPPGSLSGGRLPKSLAGLSKRSSYWSSFLVLPFSRLL
jgi:hypothetical protein